MNPLMNLLQAIPEREVSGPPFEVPEKTGQESTIQRGSAPWDPAHFAQEQIRSLVRQVFSPGWPKPARQVALTAVDQKTNITNVCEAVAHELSAQVSGSVCMAATTDACFASSLPYQEQAFDPEHFRPFRSSARQLSQNLWKISPSARSEVPRSVISPALARTRMNDLRLQFDYTILNCPSAGQQSEAALLGQFCDGVVLVLNADCTHRVAAQKAQQMLQASNARVVGAVLLGRRFPIPEGLYRKL
jgi:hypothetical protein